MKKQLSETIDIKSRIKVNKEYQMIKSTIVYPIPVFWKNASDCSLTENLSFGGRRGTDEFEDVTDAERDSVKRRRKNERSDPPYAFQHLSAIFVSLYPAFDFFSLFRLHFSIPINTNPGFPRNFNWPSRSIYTFSFWIWTQ